MRLKRLSIVSPTAAFVATPRVEVSCPADIDDIAARLAPTPVHIHTLAGSECEKPAKRAALDVTRDDEEVVPCNAYAGRTCTITTGSDAVPSTNDSVLPLVGSQIDCPAGISAHEFGKRGLISERAEEVTLAKVKEEKIEDERFNRRQAAKALAEEENRVLRSEELKASEEEKDRIEEEARSKHAEECKLRCEKQVEEDNAKLLELQLEEKQKEDDEAKAKVAKQAAKVRQEQKALAESQINYDEAQAAVQAAEAQKAMAELNQIESDRLAAAEAKRLEKLDDREGMRAMMSGLLGEFSVSLDKKRDSSEAKLFVRIEAEQEKVQANFDTSATRMTAFENQLKLETERNSAANAAMARELAELKTKDVPAG